jgi:hypothetical protein
MPSIETIGLNDFAVLWSASTLDSYGKPKISAAIEIAVRWEGRSQDSSDPNNSIEATPAEVFVDRAITSGSIMWQGRLQDLPASPTNLFEVTACDYIPDIKCRNTQRTVTLTKYNNSLLPDLV